MIEITTFRWLAAMALRNPIAWLLGAAMVAVWPLLIILLSLGVTTSSKPPASALYEIGFLAAQLGAMLAIATLSQGSWWLSRTTQWRRFRAEFTGIATGSLALICAAWIAPVVTSWSPASLPLGHMLATAIIASMFLAAIGVCILALPLGSLARVSMVPLTVWFIPSLLTGNHWAMRGFCQCFELAGYFRFPRTEESPAYIWPLGVLPILGLCLLRLAEASRRAFSSCATPS